MREFLCCALILSTIYASSFGNESERNFRFAHFGAPIWNTISTSSLGYENKRCFHIACFSAPISRVLYCRSNGMQRYSFIWDDCHQSPQAALSSVHVAQTSTALHAGRNFAVAPFLFPKRLILADAVASQRGRLCSHPWDYPDRRYLLPCCTLASTRARTFLPRPLKEGWASIQRTQHYPIL